MGLSSLVLAVVMGVSFLEGILCQEFKLEGPSEILPTIYAGDLWSDLGASLSELQPVFLLVDNPLPRAPLYAEPPRRGNGRHRNSPPNHFRPPPEDSVVPSHSQRSVKVLSDLGVLNRPHQNLRTEISYGRDVPIAFRNKDPLKPTPNFEQNRPSLETNLHTLEGLIPLPIRDNGEFKLTASRFQNTGHNYDRLRNAKIRDEMEPRMRHRNAPNHHQPRPVASKPAGNFVEYTVKNLEQQVPNRPAERIFKNRVNLRPPVNVRPSSYNHDSWKSSTQLQNDLPDSVAAQNSLNTSRVTIYTDFRNIFESGTPLELNAKSSPDSESSTSSKSLKSVIKDMTPQAPPRHDKAPPDMSSERQNYLSRSLVTTRRPSSAPFVGSRFRNAPQSAPRHEKPADPPVALPPLETKEERSRPVVEAFDLKSLYQEDPQDNSKVQFDDEVPVRNSSSFIGSPSISSSVTINANTVAKPNKPLAVVAKPPTIAKKPIKKKQQKVEKEPEEEIQGIPGTDYPTFSDIPDTRFKCDGPGFYADLDTGCQVFHNCDAGGQKHSFLCPNGTVFRQELFICDWWYNVRCELSQEHFPLNDGLFPSSKTAS